MQSLRQQLETLGLSTQAVEAIVQDLQQQDGRSLFSAVLLRSLWMDVQEAVAKNPVETQCKIHGPLFAQLLAQGADPDDLLALLRETQINTLRSALELLDWPTRYLESWPDEWELEVLVKLPQGTARPLYALHTELGDYDPVGHQAEAHLQEALSGLVVPTVARLILYRTSTVIVNSMAQQLLGHGLRSAVGTFAGGRAIAALAGPVGWVLAGVWTAVDLAGPAYRVTIPCVLHIAMLRLKVRAEAETEFMKGAFDG